MNITWYVVLSAFLFAMMAVLVRHLGERYPVGQVVFYRSTFAILPVVVIYAWRGELATALRIGRPREHMAEQVRERCVVAERGEDGPPAHRGQDQPDQREQCRARVEHGELPGRPEDLVGPGYLKKLPEGYEATPTEAGAAPAR